MRGGADPRNRAHLFELALVKSSLATADSDPSLVLDIRGHDTQRHSDEKRRGKEGRKRREGEG